MNKTELLSKLARSGEDKLLLARALDKLELARNRGVPACTPFLSPAEQEKVKDMMNACGHPRHVFYGGFEGAERRMCAFLPDWQGEDDFLAAPPIAALRAAFRDEGKLTHRDFLGAILGLGLDREKVGDLLVGPASCDILVSDEISDFLLMNLDAAGRTRLSVSAIELDQIQAPEVKVKLVRDTVATLRLDAVAASGFSLSRGKAAELISAGKFLLNHRECTKPDRAVAEGDTFSCRGLGKCVVKTVGGLSKKGRTMVELERYL